MGERTKLTQKTVAAIEPLEGAQRLVWDSELRGFGLRIAPAGTKSYIMQRRVNGRSRRVTIGRADDMKAEQARKKALAIASQFAEGHDPVRERELNKAREMTLRDAFDEYKRAPKKKGGGRGTPKKPQTIRDIEKAERRFSDWLDQPVTEITGRMVKERHAKIATASPAQANLAMRYLRAAFNHIIADTDEDDPVLARNPVDRLNRLNQWAEVLPADRHVPEDRVAEWLAAVQTGLVGLRHDNEIRDALIFMALTGARLAEALGNERDGYEPLRWTDVDLERRLVTFPDTKNRRAHDLPLPRELAKLLAERKEASGPDYVFSDREGDVPSDLRAAYKRIEVATGLWITAHDLRRTFATVASKLDISAYKLKRLTNHISGGDVTAGYVQVTTEDLRDAMQRIEDFILSPARTSGGNVVKLEKAQ